MSRQQRTSTVQTLLPGFVVLRIGERRILHEVTTYEKVIEAALEEAPELGDDPDHCAIGTYEIPLARGELVEIPRSAFSGIISRLTQLCVFAKPCNVGILNKPSLSDTSESVRRDPLIDTTVQVFVKTLTGKTITISIPLRETVATLKALIQDKERIPSHRLSPIFAGRSLEDSRTLASYHIKPESTIHLVPTLRGGKPVIYLFSPTLLDATVELALVPEWEFSAVYPVVPVKQNQEGQAITWTTQCRPDGTILDKTSNLEVTYLFWEAETTLSRPLTPPLSPSIGDQERFCPIISDVDNDNSVLLTIAQLPQYLDSCLKALALHTEARTSFITYWLPAFLKHKYIALRFVPQRSYERAAPLNVTPTPDIITRIFMLFRGVAEDDIADFWKLAIERVTEDVIRWVDIVGVDIQKANDPSLFRVLEWGGMEKK